MANATPAVVEKALIDIDFSRGLNEAIGPESLDWTKFLKVADNVDFGNRGTITSRAGLYAITSDSDDSSVSPSQIVRVLPTSNGVLALGGTATGILRAYQLNESAQSLATSLSRKNNFSEYSVNPQVVCGINGTGPRIIGSCYTPRYNITVYTPNSTDYYASFVDKDSGNVVRSYLIAYSTSRAAIALVSNRYLHVYLGQAASAKVYQFDTDALPVTVPSGVSLTSGAYIVGAVAISTSSYVVMSNGNVSKCGTVPSETAAGSVAGFDTDQLHDVATDGTSIFIIGRNNTPRGLIKVLSTALATTRTVTDTDATLAAARFSIGCDSDSSVCAIAHYVTTVGSFSYPTARVITVGSAASVFTSVSALPCWGAFAAPICSPLGSGNFYGALLELPGAGLGAGHNTTLPVGANCLVALTAEKTWQATPIGFHAACITDQYLDWAGAHIETTGSLTNTQHLFTADDGKTLTMAAIQKTGPESYNVEHRKLLKNDTTQMICSGDIISGGKTSTYDGSCVSELGCLSVPTITVVDAGSGTGLTNGGVYNYTAVFEFVDALGRRHLSRCANPFTITMAANHDTTVTVSFPTVSDHSSTSYGQGAVANHYDFKYHIYRTVSGGTQYQRVSSATVITGASTTATLSVTDSTTDTALASKELLHRQPGTPGTALDRYYAPASSCAVRHKDRVFCARGSTVYYSSFSVFGEAPWFNPAFSIEVFGGTGNITALASMDGTLVVFKKNAIFVIDGDGPPENGGSGAEFSPPRKILTDLGCVDGRTLLTTDNGLMFRSRRGIELLARNLTISWLGERVFRTVDAFQYNGGAAFDVATGRCVWLLGSAVGSWPGQIVTSGYAVVYDTASDTWSRYILRTADGYGLPFQDVCFAETGSSFLSIAQDSRLVYADHTKLWVEYGRVDHNTSDAFIPVTLETGWVKGTSKSDNIRVTDLYLWGTRNADCTMAFSYAADYSSSYTAVKTFTPSVTGAMTVVNLDVMPPKEAVQAMSFKIVTSDPTPTSFGVGSQWDIWGLSVRVGLRAGGRGMAAAQRG